MAELSRLVDDLVRAATSEVDPKTIRGTVESVLGAFDKGSAAPRTKAVTTLAKALTKADGRGAQVLCLALGAMVESGADPALAWPAIARGLDTALDQATAFASAVVRQAKVDDLEEALEAAGAVVARKKPREADAWKGLPSRCLAAVACLTRSRALRAKAAANTKLLLAAWPLSDAVVEVGAFLQAARIVDDDQILVLSPATSRGWRMTIDNVPSNAELYVLLADAIVGEPRQGKLPGKRPDARAVAAVKSASPPKKETVYGPPPFRLRPWTALAKDGATFADANHEDPTHFLWPEGVAADIPVLGKERIVLVESVPLDRPVPVAPPFEGLKTTLRIDEDLAYDDVRALLAKIGKAAQKHRPARRVGKKKQTEATERRTRS